MLYSPCLLCFKYNDGETISTVSSEVMSTVSNEVMHDKRHHSQMMIHYFKPPIKHIAYSLKCGMVHVVFK